MKILFMILKLQNPVLRYNQVLVQSTIPYMQRYNEHNEVIKMDTPERTRPISQFPLMEMKALLSHLEYDTIYFFCGAFLCCNNLRTNFQFISVLQTNPTWFSPNMAINIHVIQQINLILTKFEVATNMKSVMLFL